MILAFFSIHSCFAQYDFNKKEKPIKNANNAILNNPVIKRPYDFSSIKECREIAPPVSPLPPRAASNAYTMYTIDANGNVSNVAFQRQPLAAYTDRMWVPGETIKVGFDITGSDLTTHVKGAKICQGMGAGSQYQI